MVVLRTQATFQICGTKNAWSIESDNPDAQRAKTFVTLEIQGNSQDGYHLIMSPDGFFTADHWYENIDDAFEAGHELFSVSKEQWHKIGQGEI